jgi:hypothetical protein
MVIFHSCVSLPEGNGDFDGDGPMGYIWFTNYLYGLCDLMDGFYRY